MPVAICIKAALSFAENSSGSFFGYAQVFHKAVHSKGMGCSLWHLLALGILWLLALPLRNIGLQVNIPERLLVSPPRSACLPFF